MASLTVFLPVRENNTRLYPLPGKFATIPYVLYICIIALKVLWGMFNCFVFSEPIPGLVKVSFESTIFLLFSPILMDDNKIFHACYLIFILK